METASTFIDRSIHSAAPANIFVVIDTPADTHSGRLQYKGGSTKPEVASASEILLQFCGENAWEKARMAAAAARKSDVHASASKSGWWYRTEPFARGGWRGLLLGTNGSAVSQEVGFDDLKRLVDQDSFDFVLAFTGSVTLSRQILTTVSKAIEGVGVDKRGNLWETLAVAIGQDSDMLKTNGVVIIFRERETSGVMVRKIGLHHPPHRVWGMEFDACMTEGCRPTPRDFLVKSNESGIRMMCRLCLWRSATVKATDGEGLLNKINGSMPKVYWHSYPASLSLRNLFVAVTKEKERGEGDGASTTKKRKR
ncbi:hypothetical protein HD554DRAFT_815522 [Boletus coccyginus]|nr:hypothetical protein HD554DRAFT_815522 [Boletus coccyginus]